MTRRADLSPGDIFEHGGVQLVAIEAIACGSSASTDACHFFNNIRCLDSPECRRRHTLNNKPLAFLRPERYAAMKLLGELP